MEEYIVAQNATDPEDSEYFRGGVVGQYEYHFDLTATTLKNGWRSVTFDVTYEIDDADDEDTDTPDPDKDTDGDGTPDIDDDDDDNDGIPDEDDPDDDNDGIPDKDDKDDPTDPEGGTTVGGIGSFDPNIKHRPTSWGSQGYVNVAMRWDTHCNSFHRRVVHELLVLCVALGDTELVRHLREAQPIDICHGHHPDIWQPLQGRQMALLRYAAAANQANPQRLVPILHTIPFFKIQPAQGWRSTLQPQDGSSKPRLPFRQGCSLKDPTRSLQALVVAVCSEVTGQTPDPGR